MKTLSTKYKNSIVGKQVVTIATCFKIILKDGTKLGFTTHTRNIVFEDEKDLIYKTAKFTPTAVSKSNQMNVDNMNADLLIDHTTIKDEDLERGLWNNAKVFVFRFNYMIKPYLYLNIEKIIDGEIGQMERKNGVFQVEFRSKTQYLQNNIVDVTKATCNAKFGDDRCKIDLSSHTFTDTVATKTNNRIFTATSLNNVDGDFNGGIITFTSGEAKGRSMEVKYYTSSNKKIELQLPLNFNIQVGDSFTIIRGCNKTKTRCKDFSNVINFRGFSFVPGVDAYTGGNK